MVLSVFCKHDYRQKTVYLTTTNGGMSEARRLVNEIFKPYSDANIYRCATTETEDITDSEGHGAYAMVGFYAQLYFKEVANPQNRHCLVIPAPDESLFEDAKDGGQRVKPDVGAWIATRFSAIFDVNVTFTGGALCGSSEV